jgi:RNA polymerase sigma factor (sigma-70 family)
VINVLTREEQILSLRPCVEYHAHRMAHRFAHDRPATYEDFCSEGWIGAIQATDAFEPDHGCSLRTFAERRIRGAMVDSVRGNSEDRRKWVNGKYVPHHVVVLSMEPAHLRGRSNDGDMRAVATHITLGWLLAGADLSSQQREVINLFFAPAEPTNAETGRALGKSESRIFQIKEEALAKLRKAA